MAASMRRRVGMLFYRYNLKRSAFASTSCRLLLTDEYKCHEAWNQRLQSPLLQKIDIDNFLLKIQEKLSKEGFVSAVDMDIVANKLESIDPQKMDGIQQLLYSFRHAKGAASAFESMSHAVIRALLSFGQTERLMEILKDKIHYGIFLDDFTANLLLDHFIEHQQYQEAAEIAYDLMLQEDFTHPLSRMLSWRACHLRLAELLAGEDATEETAADEGEEEELMYRRVRYIENPWYDNHFDIPTERQKLGKTLTMVASPDNDTVSRGYLLLGWALYEKLDHVLTLLQEWLNDTTVSSAVTLPQLEMVQTVIERIKTRDPPEPKEPGLLTLQDLYPCITEQQKSDYLQQFTELTEKLKAAGKVASAESEDAGIELARRTEKTYDTIKQSDIERQTELYHRWVDERQQELDKELEEYRVAQKKKDIAHRLLELRAREEKLRFFEKQTEIELEITDAPVQPTLEEVVEEEQFVAPPGERKADSRKKAR